MGFVFELDVLGVVIGVWIFVIDVCLFDYLLSVMSDNFYLIEYFE